MKFDKEHINLIIQALENGDGRVRACKIANISYQTFLDWMTNKIEFSDQIKKAERSGYDKIKDLQIRKVVEDKSWQSGAWWLERKYPEEYRSRTEHTGQMLITGITITRGKQKKKRDDKQPEPAGDESF